MIFDTRFVLAVTWTMSSWVRYDDNENGGIFSYENDEELNLPATRFIIRNDGDVEFQNANPWDLTDGN